MTQVVPPVFAPSLDLNWARNPGVLMNMSGFAPLQRGVFGTVGETTWAITLTADVLHAEIFRKVAGTTRFLAFRDSDIDEYSPSRVLTNRGTGYTATYADMWSAAAWGDLIVATNNVDAIQSSTGAGFTAHASLAGVTAKFVAAGVNFVMIGNTNTSTDQVRWSALRNPNSWTADIRTQSGDTRLLDTPGPITALVSLRDGFVAFKENAIYVGEYVGPAQFVFRWRCVSQRIGCSARRSVVEIDGKLYFVHQSGVFEFDGQTIRNVGTPVFTTMLEEGGRIATTTGGRGIEPPSGLTEPSPLSIWAATGDDIDGIYHVMLFRRVVLNGRLRPRIYSYNVRTQQWARGLETTQGGSYWSVPTPLFVKASTADLWYHVSIDGANAFDPRMMILDNSSAPGATYYGYPAPSLNGVASITTGPLGSYDVSDTRQRTYIEAALGSDDDPISAVTLDGYINPSLTKTNGSTACVQNTELDCYDGRISARYVTTTCTVGTNKTLLLAGIGIDSRGGGAR